MSPRLSGGFLDEWQNLPRWMIGFGPLTASTARLRAFAICGFPSFAPRASWPDVE
jgi:hypothetical protein